MIDTVHFTLTGFRALCGAKIIAPMLFVSDWSDWFRVTCARCTEKKPRAEKVCDANHDNYPTDFPEGWRPGDEPISTSKTTADRSPFSIWLDTATQADKDESVSIECRERATGRVLWRVGRSTEFDYRRIANWNRPGGVCESDGVEIVRGSPDELPKRRLPRGACRPSTSPGERL